LVAKATGSARPAPARNTGGAGTTGSAADEILARLRQGGGRITTARRLVVETLLESPHHQTAEELASQVQAHAPEVHISTVYRNLDELEKLGVISHAHLGHGAAVYHLSDAAHGHLVCSECGWVEEAPISAFDGLARNLRRDHGFELDTRHFAVQGLCSHCRAAAD
jgi:Fe2+ or Zn2+ uptake regulation protein